MTLAVDERTRRQARARALAAAILDTPHLPRRFSVGEGAALLPSPRRRLHRRPPAAIPVPTVTVPRRLRRRHVAAAILAVQLVVLAAMLLLPTFHVRAIEVRGAHLLSGDAVTRAAGLTAHQSIFAVDGEGARRRLAALPWVRSVAVETALPATVRVDITERDPVLRVLRPDGDLLVAAGGAMLPAAEATPKSIPPLPILEDDRPVPSGSSRPPLDNTLLTLLADTAARFPATYGCRVSAFRWQPDGLLTIVAATGWRAILGHVDSPDRVVEIPEQLAALAALRGRVDFAHPGFGYVDLEDSRAPAVGGTPGAPLPAPILPEVSPAPVQPPAPPPGPTPTPGPTPAATPAVQPRPGSPTPPPTIGVPVR